MNFKCMVTSVVAAGLFLLMAEASALDVNITKDLASITIKHGDKTVTVQRDQNPNAVVDPEFAKTSRKCPPFCVQPMEAAPGVKTIGVVEVIHFMNKELKEGSGVLVDARTPDWHNRGTIPGSMNVPYTDVSTSLGADDLTLADSMQLFGVSKKGKEWNFSGAKNLVLWCNGEWCGQSPAAIHGLLELGYPANKLFYFRGGMQSWKILGLTVLPPAKK